MKTFKTLFSIFTFFFILNVSYSQEILKNDDIVFMLGIGLSEEVVKEKINNTFNDFDTSMEGLRKLAESKVPQSLIALMVSAANNDGLKYKDPNDPMVMHSGGFYYMQNNKLERLEYSAYSQGKTSGNAVNLLTRGMAGTKSEILVADSTARQKFYRNPVFYFYADSRANSSFEGYSVSSPNEFVCVKLKQDQNSRTITVGSSNIDGAKSGISSDVSVSFQFEKLKDGIYKIFFSEPLEKGEYAFMNSGNVSLFISSYGAGSAQQNRAFDFSIK